MTACPLSAGAGLSRQFDASPHSPTDCTTNGRLAGPGRWTIRAVSSIRTTRKQCTSVARVATGAGVARESGFISGPLGFLLFKSPILLTTSPLRVVLFTWSPHSQSIDGSIGPSGACKTRKDVAAIAVTVSERSEPIILQILIEQTPRAAKIVKSPAKIAWPNAVEFCESRTVRERGQSDSAISTRLFAVCESSEIPLKYPRR